MTTFKFYVRETRNYTRIYTVEAESREAAIEKAEIGDTVDEDEYDDTDYDVVGRSISTDMEFKS